MATDPDRAQRSVPTPSRAYGRLDNAASPFPVVLAVLSIISSIVLGVITATTASFIPLGEIAFPLAAGSTLVLSLAGYILTPLTVIAALAWDRVAQRKGLQADRNYGLKPRFSSWLQKLTIAAFVLALWHILNIASRLAGGA